MAAKPVNMEQLVECLEKRFGAVELFSEDGLTKLRVGGIGLAFPEAERLCLGKATLEELRDRSGS